MRVLVTDGDERAALAAARSLVRAGFEVWVAAGRRWSLASVSRGVRPVVLSTDLLADPPGYAVEVGHVAQQVDARVLLPITDPSVEAVLAARRAMPPALALPFPPLATYREASDKLLMLDRAARAGLAVPETRVLEHVDAELPGAMFFPAVLKPHRSVVSAAAGGVGRRKLAVRFVDDPGQCGAALRALPATAFPVLLQRRVSGPGEGLFVLRWNGRVIAEFAHRRLREKPPAGGVSVYRESIALDPVLVAAGRRLLADLDWQGVAMVECKRDAETGRHVFMELNGRLWGSLQLAIDAGVDFPALLVACALGADVPAVTGYRVGVRSRWFWGDVDHLYLRLRDGGGRAARLAAVRDFFRLGFGRDREEIWRWRDPAPFVLESFRRIGLAP
ncbi:MAG TPA: ATP-grasp domain-containing protein [Gemmatimonadales bacterium]|jgi:predicted ATP-grasp superfamily ATP-dependent carboligase|nr:ATP-grasp domain-containing protein [Gemmatimonadales bacterium]